MNRLICSVCTFGCNDQLHWVSHLLSEGHRATQLVELLWNWPREKDERSLVIPYIPEGDDSHDEDREVIGQFNRLLTCFSLWAASSIEDFIIDPNFKLAVLLAKNSDSAEKFLHLLQEKLTLTGQYAKRKLKYYLSSENYLKLERFYLALPRTENPEKFCHSDIEKSLLIIHKYPLNLDQQFGLMIENFTVTLLDVDLQIAVFKDIEFYLLQAFPMSKVVLIEGEGTHFGFKYRPIKVDMSLKNYEPEIAKIMLQWVQTVVEDSKIFKFVRSIMSSADSSCTFEFRHCTMKTIIQLHVSIEAEQENRFGCILMAFLLTFDKRAVPLTNFLLLWNAHRRINLPAPLMMNLVIVFLNKIGAIPTINLLQSLVPETRRNVCNEWDFSVCTDEQRIAESFQSLPDGNSYTPSKVIDLAGKFFEFYGENNLKDLVVCLLTGELITREFFYPEFEHQLPDDLKMKYLKTPNGNPRNKRLNVSTPIVVQNPFILTLVVGCSTKSRIREFHIACSRDKSLINSVLEMEDLQPFFPKTFGKKPWNPTEVVDNPEMCITPLVEPLDKSVPVDSTEVTSEVVPSSQPESEYSQDSSLEECSEPEVITINSDTDEEDFTIIEDLTNKGDAKVDPSAINTSKQSTATKGKTTKAKIRKVIEINLETPPGSPNSDIVEINFETLTTNSQTTVPVPRPIPFQFVARSSHHDEFKIKTDVTEDSPPSQPSESSTKSQTTLPVPRPIPFQFIGVTRSSHDEFEIKTDVTENSTLSQPSELSTKSPVSVPRPIPFKFIGVTRSSQDEFEIKTDVTEDCALSQPSELSSKSLVPSKANIISVEIPKESTSLSSPMRLQNFVPHAQTTLAQFHGEKESKKNWIDIQKSEFILNLLNRTKTFETNNQKAVMKAKNLWLSFMQDFFTSSVVWSNCFGIEIKSSSGESKAQTSAGRKRNISELSQDSNEDSGCENVQIRIRSVQELGENADPLWLKKWKALSSKQESFQAVFHLNAKRYFWYKRKEFLCRLKERCYQEKSADPLKLEIVLTEVCNRERKVDLLGAKFCNQGVSSSSVIRTDLLVQERPQFDCEVKLIASAKQPTASRLCNSYFSFTPIKGDAKEINDAIQCLTKTLNSLLPRYANARLAEWLNSD